MNDPNLPLDTIRVGLIGAGIQASASPRMHMEEAKQNGLSLRYDLFDLDLIPQGAAALQQILLDAELAGYAGVNVTHPCKQSVIKHLHELSADARALGAVNCVVFNKGQRIGHNTDWFGFFENFQRSMAGAPFRIVTQLGAGGAGSAVAYAMLRMGTQTLYLLDTDAEKARELAALLSPQFGAERINVITTLTDDLNMSDGLINTTPVGMAKYPGLPLPEDLLRPSLWVAEVVYFPLETALLKVARAAGCRTVDGGGMAVFQAVESFRLFTGIMPDANRMLRWFRTHFAA